MYLSDIRAAVSAGQRPVAMLLNDAYGGHRKWWDPEWREDPSLANVWTEWDYILMRVFQYMEDYTTANGHPIWVEEDPDVDWEIDTRASFYEREISLYKDDHDLKPWESVRAIPHWEGAEEPPSMAKWLKRMEEEDSGRDERPKGGRPPTAEELAALRGEG